jgi:hypothetical protein
VSDTIVSLLVIVLVFIGLPLCILWVRDRVKTTRWRRTHSPQTRIAERHAYEQRILQPDWACVERHLQRPVPQGLRDLYADRDLVTAQDLQYAMDHSISTFEALDEQAFADAKSWLGFEVVAFATTDAGDTIYLRLGSAEIDTVYLTHHDGGDTEIFAESAEEMLRVLRQRTG